jgi:serine protease AprX
MTPRRLVALLTVLTALAAAAPASAAERIVRFDPQATSAAQLTQRLSALGLRSAALERLPFAAVTGDAALLDRLPSVPGVVSTHANERLQFHLHESARLVFGGEDRRAAAYAAGFDGTGQTVAVIDSGTDGLHPDLRDRVVRNVKIAGTDGIATDDSFRHYVECSGPCTTDTTSGHGTHVSGTAVGGGEASDGLYTGIAPGAKLVGISTGEVVAVFHALQAFDYLLDHPELGVTAINNSWGPSGGGRFDADDPVNVATKAAHDAGMTVVFSAGNSGPGGEAEPDGASDCSPDGEGSCVINPYSVAPWVISVAATRKDHEGGAGDQPLAFFSSRGDPDPQPSLDGRYTIAYQPTLAAPGVNIRAARAPTGALQATCGTSAEPGSCVPPRPESEPYYFSSSGTSMSAPHVTGAIAVVQSAAAQRLGRTLAPGEVKDLLTRTAAPMTQVDGLWDWPCGTAGFVECGADVAGTTAKPYAPWQVGAGALDVGAALDAVAAIKTKRKKRRP